MYHFVSRVARAKLDGKFTKYTDFKSDILKISSHDRIRYR